MRRSVPKVVLVLAGSGGIGRRDRDARDITAPGFAFRAFTRSMGTRGLILTHDALRVVSGLADEVRPVGPPWRYVMHGERYDQVTRGVRGYDLKRSS